MNVVAGVDFGTQSVRVSIVDAQAGVIGFATSEYPVLRTRTDPDFATQSHQSHMDALRAAMAAALADAGIAGSAIKALALDTTGSSVIPVGENLEPLGDYYLWCDHRAAGEAAEITAMAHAMQLPAIRACGGVYSSEWGFAKLLHWLRNNPDQRERFVTAFEHCDMVAATLCGVTDPERVTRSICAMGHKWLWQGGDRGLPADEFLVAVDPLLAGVRDKLGGAYRTSDHVSGGLSSAWAERLGLTAGIPIPVGAFDCHWDAIGAGIATGDVVNVVGTASCIMAIAEHEAEIPGLCGIVPGSIHPGYVGIEAGLSAAGDLFESIARRANTTVAALAAELGTLRAGETGLLRIGWDNGDRTVLVNPLLGGVTLGLNMTHTAADELFAAIEGTAFNTRIVLDRMAEHGVPVHRVIHAGGIPQKNPLLNQIYANVINKPVLVPERPITSLGAAIFACLAAGLHPDIESAQRALCPSYLVVEPQPEAVATYQRLFAIYRELYFAMGVRGSSAIPMGDVLPALREIARQVRTR